MRLCTYVCMCVGTVQPAAHLPKVGYHTLPAVPLISDVMIRVIAQVELLLVIEFH